MDAVACVAIANALAFDADSLRTPKTGFPLTFACLLIVDAARLLPAITQVHSYAVRAWEVTALFLFVDAMQYVLHRCMHRWCSWSHAIHHTYRVPSQKTAFHTGWLDASVQLLAPMYAAVWTVAPQRGSLICFGVLYSVWLQWIHIPRPRHTPLEARLHAIGFVTPSFHQVHHKDPRKHFGHFVQAWDCMGGTC